MQIGDAVTVFGDVLRFHVDESVLVDGRPDALKLRPVARLGGPYYSTLSEILRPTRQDHRGGSKAVD